ncbi:hypothetical protein HY734_01875 [Candidatus Uhrbacteria bacterium]|nr:hypothetical protein [Candidatus Uhrbacteria bacterium]
MALKQTQQVLESIRRSSNPLLVIPRGAGADGYASALGLARLMDKIGKRADIVAADGPTPAALHFLKDHERVRSELPHLRKLVIDIDVSKTRVQDIAKEERDGRLLLSLTPNQGFWAAHDVRISTSEYRYDLLICVGGADLEACAHLYEQQPDFFYRTPIVNIDHSPANEHFGHLNVVDVTASACGEVCHDLIEAMDPTLIDEETATALLTGMIAKTKSFKTAGVTPKTLQAASRLMGQGARRDDIVRSLYRTRSVHTLRLWGRALARLKSDPAMSLVWSLLSRQDFLHAGAEEEDLEDIVDELISSSPQATVAVLLYETSDHGIQAVIRAERPFDALRLAAAFHPTGTQTEARMHFEDHGLVQVEKVLIPAVLETMKH